MLKILAKGLLAGLAVKRLDDGRRLSLHLLKIEAARVYLHGLRLARLSALGLIQMGLAIGLICVGALLFHVSLFVLLPCTLKAKSLLGLLLGVAYTGVGCTFLCTRMADKTWIKRSGVAALLDSVTSPPPSD